MKQQRIPTLAAALAIGLGVPGLALAQAAAATATLKTADGADAGTATFQDLPAGVLISVDLANMTPGEHGIHIHQTGACTPDFTAAGEHFAPGGEGHGFAVTENPHPGDLPNIVVAEDGTAAARYINNRFKLADLFDDDGAALIVHAQPDSYQAEAGAGDREACGVIEPSS